MNGHTSPKTQVALAASLNMEFHVQVWFTILVEATGLFHPLHTYLLLCSGLHTCPAPTWHENPGLKDEGPSWDPLSWMPSTPLRFSFTTTSAFQETFEYQGPLNTKGPLNTRTQWPKTAESSGGSRDGSFPTGGSICAHGVYAAMNIPFPYLRLTGAFQWVCRTSW